MDHGCPKGSWNAFRDMTAGQDKVLRSSALLVLFTFFSTSTLQALQRINCYNEYNTFYARNGVNSFTEVEPHLKFSFEMIDNIPVIRDGQLCLETINKEKYMENYLTKYDSYGWEYRIDDGSIEFKCVTSQGQLNYYVNRYTGFYTTKFHINENSLGGTHKAFLWQEGKGLCVAADKSF